MFIFPYIGALITLVLLDFVWLGFIAKSFYQKHIGHLFGSSMHWGAIALFYVLYAGAIYYFAVAPSDGVWQKALLGGVLLGLTAYGTYDLVNYATLRDWPVVAVVIDMAWGAVITGAAAFVASKLL